MYYRLKLLLLKIKFLIETYYIVSKKLYLFIIMLCAGTSMLYSQAPRGDFKVMRLQDNLDTVVINRTLADWWFGITGGVSGALSVGNLKFPEQIDAPDVYKLKLIDYKTGTGFGAYLGLYGEWLPIEEMWGAYLRINFLDKRKSKADGEQLKDTFQTKYDNEYVLNYISISPGIRYNLPIENLFVTAGLDIDINLSNVISVYRHRVNTEKIVDELKMPDESKKVRYGLNFGIGYDIFVVDMYDAVRSYLTPYASLHFGTYELTNFDSKRVPLIAKVGLNIKFNIDRKKYDTLKLDINNVEPPKYIASYKKELGVDFTGFKPEERIYSELKEVPEQKIDIVVKEEPKIKEEITTKVTPKEEPAKKNITINPNQSKIFYYPNSESATLTNVQKEYLDALSEYLKKNPNVTVRISGHSDNAGSTEQNQARSENRATNVVQYLVKNGIPRRRLLDRGRGALEPIADNTTATGRAKNRRVEIQIVR